MSMTHSTCPSWCDPRVHVNLGPHDHEHREEGLTFKPLVADTELAVRLVQLEEIQPVVDSPSDVMVHMTIRDDELDIPVVVGTDLNPSDARMLAAVLVSAAERCEAAQRRNALVGGAR